MTVCQSKFVMYIILLIKIYKYTLMIFISVIIRLNSLILIFKHSSEQNNLSELVTRLSANRYLVWDVVQNVSLQKAYFTIIYPCPEFA